MKTIAVSRVAAAVALVAIVGPPLATVVSKLPAMVRHNFLISDRVAFVSSLRDAMLLMPVAALCAANAIRPRAGRSWWALITASAAISLREFTRTGAAVAASTTASHATAFQSPSWAPALAYAILAVGLLLVRPRLGMRA